MKKQLIESVKRSTVVLLIMAALLLHQPVGAKSFYKLIPKSIVAATAKSLRKTAGPNAPAIAGTNASFTGEFRTIKKLNDGVTANEVIGEIYNGGVWNKLLAPADGKISYILTNGTKAEKNHPVCIIIE